MLRQAQRERCIKPFLTHYTSRLLKKAAHCVLGRPSPLARTTRVRLSRRAPCGLVIRLFEQPARTHASSAFLKAELRCGPAFPATSAQIHSTLDSSVRIGGSSRHGFARNNLFWLEGAMRLVLLPVLDGTGELLHPYLKVLPSRLRPQGVGMSRWCNVFGGLPGLRADFAGGAGAHRG
jgi:hypothetical protein